MIRHDFSTIAAAVTVKHFSLARNVGRHIRVIVEDGHVMIQVCGVSGRGRRVLLMMKERFIALLSR